MDLYSADMVLISAFVIGVIAGYSVRRARLCLFGSIESLLFGGDTRRIKALAVGLAIAIAITQALIIAGLLERPDDPLSGKPCIMAFHCNRRRHFRVWGWRWWAPAPSDVLVRLGGGDLRSLIAILLIGAVAFASLYGTLTGVRTYLAAKLPLLPPIPADLPMALQLAGIPANRIWLAAAIALCLLVVGSQR